MGIDSRTIRPGEIFIAIRGVKHDGHEHVREAVEKGARNLQTALTLRAGYLNVRDLLYHEKVLMPLDALEVIKSYLGAEA